MTTPVQSPLPLEASNSLATISTTVTDGTVNTGGFASAPSAGNTVILVVHSEDLSVGSLNPPTSVADGAGNSFTRIGGGMSTATPQERVDIYYRQVTTGGQAAARTVTVTKNSSNFQEFAIYQIEIPGLWNPNAASFVGGGNSTVGQLSLTLTTPAAVPAGAFVVTSINVHDTTATTLTPSTPSGYTAIYVESNQAAVMSQLCAYKDMASTGTESVTYTGMTSTSDIASALIAAFTPALGLSAQPTDQTFTAGGTATFSVTATGGTAPYSYQWQTASGSLGSNVPGTFSNVSGATGSSYTTGALSAANEGRWYRCVVTDSASGSVTSLAVQLIQSGVGAQGRGLLYGPSAWAEQSKRKNGSAYQLLRRQMLLKDGLTTQRDVWSSWFFQSASGAALASSSAAVTASTAAIGSSIALQASAAAVTASSGTLPTGSSAALAGAASAVTASTAALGTTIPAAGSAAAVTAQSAALGTAISLQASAQAVTASSGAVSQGAVLVGAGQAVTAQSAAITTSVSLAASASAVTASQAGISAALAGSGAAVPASSGALATAIRPASASSAVTAQAAALTTSVALAAAGMAVTGSTAALTASSGLSGAGAAATSSTSALTTAIRPVGSGAAVTAGSGSLGAVSAALASASAATTSSTAALTTSNPISAANAAATAQAAALITAVRLSSSAAAVTSSSATLTKQPAALASSAAAQTVAAANLTTAVLMAASAASAPASLAALQTRVALAAAAQAGTAWAADLTAGKLLTDPRFIAYALGRDFSVDAEGRSFTAAAETFRDFTAS